MIPIRDDNPHFLTPVATFSILALNVLAWFFVQGFGSEPALTRSVCGLGLVPGVLLGSVSVGTSVELGPGVDCVLGGVAAPSTLLLHMFLHGGWMHLLGNMWFLWIFGNNVEDSMGHARFAVFYLLCGLAAAGLQLFSDPGSAIPMVGASGAIGGVMGAYLVLYPRVRVHLLFWLGFYITTFAIPAIWMLGYWFLVQVLGGVVSSGVGGGGVAFWAHVGGFAAGVALVPLFRDRALLDRHPYHGLHGRREPAFRRVR
jgi:membrane associated rhomboid family serine protease